MRQKNLIKSGVIGILILAVFFTFDHAAKKPHSRNIEDIKSRIADLAVVPSAQGDRVDSNSLYDRLEEQAKTIELKSDPFTAIPIVSEQSLQSRVVLTGILWDKDNPLAIIDDNVVKIGERVGNKTVIDIKRDRVILSDGETPSEVRLEY